MENRPFKWTRSTAALDPIRTSEEQTMADGCSQLMGFLKVVRDNAQEITDILILILIRIRVLCKVWKIYGTFDDELSTKLYVPYI